MRMNENLYFTLTLLDGSVTKTQIHVYEYGDTFIFTNKHIRTHTNSFTLSATDSLTYSDFLAFDLFSVFFFGFILK